MRYINFLIAAFAPLALSKCLNSDTTRDPLNLSANPLRLARSHLKTRELLNIDLVIHIFTAAPADLAINDALVDQVASLNNWFEPYGFHFNHRLTNLVANSSWASDIDVEKEYKMNQTHRGDYQTLNMYMIEGAHSGVCSLPLGLEYTIDQKSLDGDGCFVPLTAPSSREAGVMVHEIGHWLGLYHTFEGGCEGDGDYCDDTAPQNGASLGHVATPGDLNSCPAAETCGAGRGFANVKNHMDYSDCAHEFTPCQTGRMVFSWNNLRSGRPLGEGVVVRS